MTFVFIFEYSKDSATPQSLSFYGARLIQTRRAIPEDRSEMIGRKRSVVFGLCKKPEFKAGNDAMQVRRRAESHRNIFIPK